MILRIIISVLFFTTAPQLAFGQQEVFPFMAEVITDGVRVRAGQSENFESLQKLNTGDQIMVLNHEFSWYKVKLLPGAQSYIVKKYVEPIPDSTLGKVTVNRVNIRAGADINRSVLGQANKDDVVVIVKELDDWYQIQPLEKSIGYISDEFLKFTSNDTDSFLALLNAKQQLIKDTIAAVPSEVSQENTLNQKQISVTGVLQYEGKGYQIVIGEKSVYYVQGFESVLNEFLSQAVTISGELTVGDSLKYSYPILQISKIKLVL